jgi:hypothetical protein
MAEETKKPKLEVVGTAGEHNPNSIFDDLGSLRQASTLTVQRKTVLVNVDVGMPPNNSYFRVHKTEELDNQSVLRDKTTQTFYYVTPAMRGHAKIIKRLRMVTLALAYVWPANNVMVWPVPKLEGRDFKAWKSARAAYELARDQWVSVTWDEANSDYAIETAEGIKHEPSWPDKTFTDLLKLAFDGKVLDNENHPYVLQLRGIID